jgi:hypothetical protein
MNKINIYKKRLIGFGVLIIVLAIVVIYFFEKNEKNISQDFSIPSSKTTIIKSDIPGEYEWNKDNSEVKTFYSEKLGVTFTYLSPWGYTYGSVGDFKIESYDIVVKEEENKIYIDRDPLSSDSFPKIEVYYKDEKTPLLNAVVETFKNIDEDKCFIANTGGVFDVYSSNLYNSILMKDRSQYPQGLYIHLRCGHKGNTEIDDSEHVIMNADIPTKFIKVQVGQDLLTRDATGEYGWQDSIKILK